MNIESEKTYESTEGLLKKGTLFDMIFGKKMQDLLDKISNFLGVKKEENNNESSSTNNIINTSSIDTKKNTYKVHIETVKDLDKGTFEQTLLYLTHQQGQRGIHEIIQAAKNGSPLPTDVLKNMSYNINAKKFNKMFDVNCTSREDIKNTITPKTFLQYWYKIFAEKKNTYKDYTKYDDVITPLAKKYGVDKEMVRTLIGTESNFDSSAGNSKYKGLMAIGEKEAQKYGFSPSDRLDPVKNIEMGIRLMADNKASIQNIYQMHDTYATILNPAQDIYQNVA